MRSPQLCCFFSRIAQPQSGGSDDGTDVGHVGSRGCLVRCQRLATAFETFRGDPPRGWSFNQTTSAEGKSLVEHCDATKPEFDRWSLVQKDGRVPTADELKDYAEGRSRRSRAGTAPKLSDQFLFEALETVSDTPERTTYRCPLRRGETRDTTAAFLRATIVLHKPTHTIESIELANTEPFSPTFGVKIGEMKTLMTYSLAIGETPSLPQKVTAHVRGRAFLFKSLDADMTVTFSDYVPAAGRVSARPQPASEAIREPRE